MSSEPPLQNRVLATGEIVSDPARGLFMGNRGILHDADRRLGKARWKHKAWIICRLEWKDRRRIPMSPGAYTELFFLDEAVALAAGHRPCALCRNEDFRSFRDAAMPGASASELDRRLHAERAVPRIFGQKRYSVPIDALPDGAIFLGDAPTLVMGDTVRSVSADGYGEPRGRPSGCEVTVLTPPTSLRALETGYRPALHPGAR